MEQVNNLPGCVFASVLQNFKPVKVNSLPSASTSPSPRADGWPKETAGTGERSRAPTCAAIMQNVRGPEGVSSRTFSGKQPDGPPQLRAAGGCTSQGRTWYTRLTMVETGVKCPVSFWPCQVPPALTPPAPATSGTSFLLTVSCSHLQVPWTLSNKVVFKKWIKNDQST